MTGWQSSIPLHTLKRSLSRDTGLIPKLNARVKNNCPVEMDKIFVILGWIAGASLALAIARQLSEQKNLA
jgi:hypothetical protein